MELEITFIQKISFILSICLMVYFINLFRFRRRK